MSSQDAAESVQVMAGNEAVIEVCQKLRCSSVGLNQSEVDPSIADWLVALGLAREDLRPGGAVLKATQALFSTELRQVD